MSSAKKETLQSIHQKMASALEERVKTAAEPDGEPLTAAEITAISKFLKDNGVVIDLPSSPPATPGKALIDIPFPDPDDNIVVRHN